MSISQLMPYTVVRTSLAGLFGLMMLGASGCMIAPLDGDVIATNKTKISCVGATKKPGDMIHIDAWNHFTNSWDTIEHAYTGNSPVNAHGQQWYVWSKTIEIPYWIYWQFDANGDAYAEIRSKRFDGDDDFVGEELWTYETWEFEPEMSLIDFYKKHGTAKKGVRVFADKYVP